MELQRLSDTWLFERHPEEQIRRWVENLKYSYFKRAWGGHANDGDEFNLTLRYTDRNDFLNILKRLGIMLTTLPKNNPKPIPGTAYSQSEYATFKSEIADFPEFEQPKHLDLNGIKCYCWIEKGKITFTLSGAKDGDLFEVTEADFENCRKLEQLLLDHDLTGKVNRDFENDVTCISKTRYWDLFFGQGKRE